MQPSVLWANARVVQTCRDRETFQDLPIIILQQIGPVAVQNAWAAAGQGCAMFHFLVNALTACFDADDIDAVIVQERKEQTHRVGSATDGRDHGIGQTALAFLGGELLTHLFADNGLKITHHRRIRVWACNRTDAIEGILDVCHPIAQRIIHRVFQRAAT